MSKTREHVYDDGHYVGDSITSGNVESHYDPYGNYTGRTEWGQDDVGKHYDSYGHYTGRSDGGDEYDKYGRNTGDTPDYSRTSAK